MFATVFFLLLTLLSAAILVIFLFRAGAARPMTVWALAATLPVLAAMTAANAGQARANRVLRSYDPTPVTVAIQTEGQTFEVTLSPDDAVCLERAVRLNTDSDLMVPQSLIPIPIRKGTTVTGALPSTAVVEALSLRGQLRCPDFKPPAKPQKV